MEKGKGNGKGKKDGKEGKGRGSIKGKRKGKGKGKGKEKVEERSFKKLDARTDTQVILYSVQCYALHWTDNERFALRFHGPTELMALL